ncbi:hypothetical protein [Sphingopyxis macrogoltabida]|uniref:Uncharacterized protein n=1 Tax=Sphingopyxis macrogoltabida TaxID=33050 RepID=A0AAC8Z0U2_SPHMC|nr:hypothetical protein [Sphingopyxis macrogoltabida]ALJ13021.1 hypothetical protein LH19_09070 [Sphingopyxis macrogoltabida]AMU89512.1 hypothetical protein ATM17_10770 [Sphingopyxis macrogoltabida]
MAIKMQNPGVQAGASRDLLLGGWSHPLSTAQDWRVQMLASRYCLPPSMARDVVWLCFGEGCND